MIGSCVIYCYGGILIPNPPFFETPDDSNQKSFLFQLVKH